MKLILKLLDWFKFGKKKDGLFDETSDDDFGGEALYVPKKEDMPKRSFMAFIPTKVDQLDNDHCVGEGGGYEAEATEKRVNSGSFLLAYAKKVRSDETGQSIDTVIRQMGTSLRNAVMARVKYGICKRDLFLYKRGRRNYFSDYRNIPQEAKDDGAKHKAESAWKMAIPWTWTKFDAIITTMLHFKRVNPNKPVLIGTGNNAHRATACGYVDAQGTCDKADGFNDELIEIIKSYNIKDRMVFLDTYGERTYYKGWRFIGRDEAKTMFSPYYVIDVPRALADVLRAYNGKVVKTEDSVDCFLIKDGKKHLFPDEKTAWSHNKLLAPTDKGIVTTIEQSDFEMIPEGVVMKFEGGKNEWIVRRIAEKYKIEL